MHMNSMRINNDMISKVADRQPCASNRSGATILEVLFAIFVVIVGLLGIASILPLAARNASDSNAHNNAQALGQRWFQNFSAFRMNEPNAYRDKRLGYNWIWFNGTAPQPFEKAGLVGPTSSAWINQSFCIDPMFFTEPEVRPLYGSGAAPYQTAVFPYYTSDYNPVTDSLNPSAPVPPQPRMLRLTLGQQNVVSRKLVEDIFSSPDDISALADETDKTIPAVRLWATGAGQVSPPILKGVVSGQYSWLATLAPIEPIANAALASLPRDYLLSLVVMNRRDRQFVVDAATGSRPLGERLVNVVTLSGNFHNGNGGRVRISGHGSSPSDDVVHVGDWIMLGTNRSQDPSDTTLFFAKFRWYRIIGLSQQSQRVGDDDNFVWTRDVVLEGPDFEFVGNPVPPEFQGTQGTLMSGVVTVVERNVSIK